MAISPAIGRSNEFGKWRYQSQEPGSFQARLPTGEPHSISSLEHDAEQQVYGYHHLPLLIALQELNLLVKSPSTAPLPFAQVRKSLRLIVDDIDDAAPNDISYVYSGYAPLSIRLVQCITQKNAILSVGAPTTGEESKPERQGKKELPDAHPISGWKGFEDVLASIPGETVDVRQKADRQTTQGKFHPWHLVSQGRTVLTFVGGGQSETTTTVVFFLGGCTYTEIAALRWMSKQTKGRRFLIATTGIINGNTVSSP